MYNVYASVVPKKEKRRTKKEGSEEEMQCTRREYSLEGQNACVDIVNGFLVSART
jgi:hypothetical protein